MRDIGIVLCSLIIAVGLHEGGHAAAAALLGFRIQMFAIWPVCVHRTGGTWRLGLSRGFARGVGGFVGAYPLYGRNLRVRTIGLIFAGPISSVTTAGLCIWLAESADGSGWRGVSTLLRAIAVWSMLSVLPSFLPFAKRGTTDGRHILEILSGRAAFLRSIAIWSLICPTNNLRPRQWDPDLVSLALDDSVLTPEAGLGSTVQWLRYNWCADIGRTTCAKASLDWLLSDQASETDRLPAFWEVVWFEVFSNDDVSAARERLGVAEQFAVGLPPFMIWKAKAAVSAAEHRHKEAEDFAAKAILALEGTSNISPGLSQAIKDDLKELLERFKDAELRSHEDMRGATM